jgi:hypothetical protein
MPFIEPIFPLPLADREDYQAGVAAERERCAGIARWSLREANKPGTSDAEHLRSLMRHTLIAMNPEEGKISLSREEEIKDAIAEAVMNERERIHREVK